MLSNDLVRLYTSCRRDQVCTHSRATKLDHDRPQLVEQIFDTVRDVRDQVRLCNMFIDMGWPKAPCVCKDGNSGKQGSENCGISS